MAAAVKAPWAALAEVQHVFEQAVVEAATRLLNEGDDPVQLLIDVLLQTQQADAATEAPALKVASQWSMWWRPRRSSASHR